MINFKGHKKEESKELQIIDLTEVLLKRYNDNPKINVVGRYSVSKLWSMMNGYLKVENYTKPEPVNFEGAMNMWQGTHKHVQVQELLDEYDKEIKIVKKIEYIGGDFEIVGMCDAINPEHGLELKTSQKLHSSAKRWHVYQAKIYCTMFEREIFKVVQPVRTKERIYLNVLEEVKRNDSWFNKEMQKLGAYHEQLKLYEKSKNN